MLVIQEPPPLVEVKIWPLLATATNLAPLVEDATAVQEAVARLDTFQSWAEAGAGKASCNIAAAQAIRIRFVFIADDWT